VGDALDQVGLDLVVGLKSFMPYIGDGIVASFVVLAKVRVLGALLGELGSLEG
jgi:hypothetical protein